MGQVLPGLYPDDTTSDADPPVNFDTGASGSSDDSSSTDFGGGNLVENNAAGCNSVEKSCSLLHHLLQTPLCRSFSISAESDTYSGISTLRGWAVAEEGISKVDIYIDDNFFQSAPYGGKRGDVGSIFPKSAIRMSQGSRLLTASVAYLQAPTPSGGSCHDAGQSLVTHVSISGRKFQPVFSLLTNLRFEWRLLCHQ